MTVISDVVCVHGLWSHAAGMALIRRRLEHRHGLRAHLYNYPSVRGSLDENAARLAEFLRQKGLSKAHFLAHSLGGVIVLRMLAMNACSGPGRIVCAGAPLSGSRAAQELSQRDWARRILGRSIETGVVNAPANSWASGVCLGHEVGIIAGTVSFGLGRLVAVFEEDNDGTVAVSETHLDGARDHICLPVSHYSMLYSPSVSDQAAAFFKNGSFLRAS